MVYNPLHIQLKSMEKAKPLNLLILFLSIVFSLSLVSFVFCVVAESKKAKKEDVKLDGKLCYVPQSDAFDYGIGAIICLVAAHGIGNLVFSGNSCFSNGPKSKWLKIISISLLIFSWIGFVVALIILSAATSMSTKQTYGKGWIDQECYVVKDRVYIGSGGFALFAEVTLGVAILIGRKGKAGAGHNQGPKTNGTDDRLNSL